MEALIKRLLGRPFMSPDTGGTGDSTPTEPATDAVSGDAKEQPTDPGEPVEEEAAPEGDDEPVVDDFEEIEYDGAKHKIPKALKPAILMQADYTRKTQELAAERKAFEARAESWKAADRETVAMQGQLAQAENMITRYQQLDWNELRARDPETVQARLIEWQQWKDHRETLSGGIATREQQRSEAQREFSAKRMEDAVAQLKRDVPNWDEVKQDVGKFAIEKLGYSEQELDSNNDPRFGRQLHWAWLGFQMSQKQAAAKQPKQPVVVEAQPVVQVATRGGQPPSRRSLADLAKSDDAGAYIAARKAGRAA